MQIHYSPYNFSQNAYVQADMGATFPVNCFMILVLNVRDNACYISGSRLNMWCAIHVYYTLARTCKFHDNAPIITWSTCELTWKCSSCFVNMCWECRPIRLKYHDSPPRYQIIYRCHSITVLVRLLWYLVQHTEHWYAPVLYTGSVLVPYVRLARTGTNRHGKPWAKQ